jgi:hypothetical protein
MWNKERKGKQRKLRILTRASSCSLRNEKGGV